MKNHRVVKTRLSATDVNIQKTALNEVGARLNIRAVNEYLMKIFKIVLLSYKFFL